MVLREGGVSPLGQYNLFSKDGGAREEEQGAEWGPGCPTPSPATPWRTLQMLHPFSEPHSPHLENGAKSDIHGEAGGLSSLRLMSICQESSLASGEPSPVASVY